METGILTQERPRPKQARSARPCPVQATTGTPCWEIARTNQLSHYTHNICRDCRIYLFCS